MIFEDFLEGLKESGVTKSPLYEEVFDLIFSNSMDLIPFMSMVTKANDPKVLFTLLTRTKMLIGLGINPDPAKGLVHWVDNVPSLSWRGLVRVLKQKDVIDEIITDNIHASDTFTMCTTAAGRQVTHNITNFFDRGEYVGTYSFCIKDKECYQVALVTKNEMSLISSRSRSSAWRDFPDEMRKKVAIRRLTKSLDIEKIDDELLGTDISFDTKNV